MKIAVLILAHKNLEQLRLLVDHLKTDFEVYVHIDRRTPHSFRDEEHVHVLVNTTAPYWGSVNSVIAMLMLLRAAYDDGCNYFMYISGQDLPLLTNKAIRDKICKAPLDYIYNKPLPNSTWMHSGGMDRLLLYWEAKRDANNLQKIMFLPLRISYWLVRKLQLITGIRRKLNFRPYGGSQWLNLTHEAATYILQFVNDNPTYLHRFRYTRLADEIFFQSILLSFAYKNKENIVSDDMRYIDWESGPEYPRLFVMQDCERCINSGKFFGRKFDDKKDSQVIRTILNVMTSTNTAK